MSSASSLFPQFGVATGTSPLGSSQASSCQSASTTAITPWQSVTDRLDKWMMSYLVVGLIFSCISNTGVPTFTHQKLGGGYCICCDYRGPNWCIKGDRYPIPLVDQVIAFAQDGGIFSKFDMKSAYQQV